LQKDGFISKISVQLRAAQGEVRMKMPARREFFAKLGAIGGLFALAAPAQAQTSAPRRFIKTDFSQSHAYSQVGR
jgi:hypothetical protein